MTAFVNEDAVRLFAVSESEIREESVIDITGTDIGKEMLSMISEHTELPSNSAISFFESSRNNSGDILINANFANVPRNNYGRPVMAVLPMQAGRLTRQIPAQPNINGNNPPDNIQVNGPIGPIPITPLVIPHELPQPIELCPSA